MAGLGFGPERQFGDDRTPARQSVVEPAVLLGVDDVDAAGDRGDAARLESAQMRGGVDPAGEAGDHDEPAAAECRGEVAGEAPAVRRCVACTDHGDHRPLE